MLSEDAQHVFYVMWQALSLPNHHTVGGRKKAIAIDPAEDRPGIDYSFVSNSIPLFINICRRLCATYLTPQGLKASQRNGTSP